MFVETGTLYGLSIYSLHCIIYFKRKNLTLIDELAVIYPPKNVQSGKSFRKNEENIGKKIQLGFHSKPVLTVHYFSSFSHP